MNLRMLSISRKELLQLRRDRLTFGMMVMVPVLQLLLFGYAINTDVRHMPTVVLDQDGTAASRDFLRTMTTTGYYDLVGAVRSHREIDDAMRSGRARVALVVPQRYASDLARGRPAQIQLVVDGSDPQTVASALNTAVSLAQVRGAEILAARALRSGSRPPAPPITLEPAILYNPELRTAAFVVPGLVGVILTLTMVMFTAMSIARERERGTLEQLIVSPVLRFELIAGKLVPYIVIGYVQMTLILAIGRWVFDVPVAGSLPLLFALASAFIAANLAVGLFFSTLVRTQQQAMQASFFFILPNILLSGFAFPWEGMPRPAQVLSQALPATHFLRVVRGIVLKSARWPDVAQEFYWLLVILVVIVTVTSLRFSKKLD